MTSLQRKMLRKNPNFVSSPKAQITQPIGKDGSIRVLHTTKGWRKISWKRLKFMGRFF